MKFAYFRKTILFLEFEIEQLKLISSFSSPFLHTKSDNSKVYFIPKSKGLGIDSMGEVAVSFELSRQFVDKEGKQASFIHITQALERAFNFNFGDAYKSKARIFSRKPYNLAKALDYLRNLITREGRNRMKMKK